MAIKKILILPDPILRKKSSPVEIVNDEIKKLMDDMLETMYKAPGIGLAAIQIGVPKRVVVMDIAKDQDKKGPMYFVNPEVTWKSNEKATYEEGCLSIPNQFANIERPEKCNIKYLDYFGVENSSPLLTMGIHSKTHRNCLKSRTVFNPTNTLIL